jgi:hypothetical protein
VLKLDVEKVMKIQPDNYKYIVKKILKCVRIRLNTWKTLQTNHSKKRMLKKETEPHRGSQVPVTWAPFAHQCREGLGPNILIDIYTYIYIYMYYIYIYIYIEICDLEKGW